MKPIKNKQLNLKENMNCIDFNNILNFDKAKLDNGKIVEFIGISKVGSYIYKENPRARIKYSWAGSGFDYMTRYGNKRTEFPKIIQIINKGYKNE